MTKDRTWLPMSSILAYIMQDRAAKGVASELDLDEEVCGMHDTDKLGRSATRQLVRSRNKQVVNPFCEGVELMKKANTMGSYFSYGKRHEYLMDTGKVLGGAKFSVLMLMLN